MEWRWVVDFRRASVHEPFFEVRPFIPKRADQKQGEGRRSPADHSKALLKNQRSDRRLETSGFVAYLLAGSLQSANLTETGGGRTPCHWPVDTDFAPWELDVLDRACPA